MILLVHGCSKNMWFVNLDQSQNAPIPATAAIAPAFAVPKHIIYPQAHVHLSAKVFIERSFFYQSINERKQVYHRKEGVGNLFIIDLISRNMLYLSLLVCGGRAFFATS